jgi:hypothetical protein
MSVDWILSVIGFQKQGEKKIQSVVFENIGKGVENR